MTYHLDLGSSVFKYVGSNKPTQNICTSCLCPIKVKTGELIESKCFVGPYMIPGEVFRQSKFKKLASNKNGFSLNFENPRIFFYKSVNFFSFFLQCIQEKMFTIEIEDGCEAPCLSSYTFLACLFDCLFVSNKS